MEHQQIGNVVKKAKKIVGNFKKSAKNTKNAQASTKKVEPSEHRLIQEEPTRWNTTYLLLKRLLEQKDALILMSEKSQVNISVELTTDDFKTMMVAVEALQIFETATREVSKVSSSISEIIPLVHTIEHFLVNLDVAGSGLMGLKNDMISSLRRRFASVEQNINLAGATLLDPCFKVAPFKESRTLEEAKKKVLDKMRAMDSVAASPSSTEDEADVSQTGGDKMSFWTHYAKA